MGELRRDLGKWTYETKHILSSFSRESWAALYKYVFGFWFFILGGVRLIVMDGFLFMSIWVRDFSFLFVAFYFI